MSRTQFASYCLLASAFVLGAMVMFQASQFMEKTANAEMVTNKAMVTMLTTKVDKDREAIYVLDSRNELLIAYELDIRKNSLEIMSKPLDIADIMQRAGGGGTTGRRPR